MKNSKEITILKNQKYPNRCCHIANTNHFQPEGDGTGCSLKSETAAGVSVLQVIEFVDKRLFWICCSNCTQSADCGIWVTYDRTSTFFSVQKKFFIQFFLSQFKFKSIYQVLQFDEDNGRCSRRCIVVCRILNSSQLLPSSPNSWSTIPKPMTLLLVGKTETKKWNSWIKIEIVSRILDCSDSPMLNRTKPKPSSNPHRINLLKIDW